MLDRECIIWLVRLSIIVRQSFAMSVLLQHHASAELGGGQHHLRPWITCSGAIASAQLESGSEDCHTLTVAGKAGRAHAQSPWPGESGRWRFA